MNGAENGMWVGRSGPLSPRKLLAAGVLTVVVGVGLLAGGMAWAGPVGLSVQRSASPDLAELEASFWQCDYAATQSAMDLGSAQACATVHDALKQRKFNGDFTLLLAWWREHKSAAHLALARTPEGPETQLSSAGRR